MSGVHDKGGRHGLCKRLLLVLLRVQSLHPGNVTALGPAIMLQLSTTADLGPGKNCTTTIAVGLGVEGGCFAEGFAQHVKQINARVRSFKSAALVGSQFLPVPSSHLGPVLVVMMDVFHAAQGQNSVLPKLEIRILAPLGDAVVLPGAHQTGDKVAEPSGIVRAVGRPDTRQIWELLTETTLDSIKPLDQGGDLHHGLAVGIGWGKPFLEFLGNGDSGKERTIVPQNLLQVVAGNLSRGERLKLRTLIELAVNVKGTEGLLPALSS